MQMCYLAQKQGKFHYALSAKLRNNNRKLLLKCQLSFQTQVLDESLCCTEDSDLVKRSAIICSVGKYLIAIVPSSFFFLDIVIAHIYVLSRLWYERF